MQCPEGHVICWSCKIRPELKGCPQCRVVKYRNFSRNRILEEVSRKMFSEEAGNKVVAAQEMEVIAAEEDVPEMRLPTYDDMGFPDYGLDRF